MFSNSQDRKVQLTNEKVIGNGSFGVVFQASSSLAPALFPAAATDPVSTAALPRHTQATCLLSAGLQLSAQRCISIDRRMRL